MSTTNRIPTPSRNGTAPAKSKAAARKPSQREASGADLRRWAVAGVGLSILLSAVLNGAAFAAAAPSPLAGWALGIAIPALILIGCRVGGHLWAHGRRRLAGATAAVVLSMLALSVQHCATSIAAATGEHVGLAALMALAIDGLLVCCELATLRK